jgi:uncharacterized protein YecE (DUF72 family)
LRKPLLKGKKQAGVFNPPTKFGKLGRRRAKLEALQACLSFFNVPPALSLPPETVKSSPVFKKIDRGSFRLVWEPRGKWTPEQIQHLCEELNHRRRRPLQRLPTSSSQKMQYFRLHGIGGYQYKFTDDDLHQFAGWCQAAPTWAMFNNTNMLQDARRFMLLIHSTT